MIDATIQIPCGATTPNSVEAILANRYRIVRQLGQGGMGSVWLAEDVQRKGKQVAIKMLPSILVKNKKAVKQLREEAEHWEKLSHPNIATLRMYEENAGNPFLVVDFIDGETLEDYLAEKGKLSEAEAVKLLAPIAKALDYAHEQGVIHRDVKPANIMVRKDGKPFVLDFGIARELHETMTRVTGALSSGTLMYMSPEQLHGAEPDPKQDIYAFAAMAYECLTGAPPFSRGQIEYQIEHDQPRPLPQSISIAPYVMSGLSKMAADRPSSCCSIVGFASESQVDPHPMKLGLGKKLFPIGGGVLLALAGVCVFLFGRKDNATVDNPPTPIETKHEVVHQGAIEPNAVAPAIVIETQIVEKIVAPQPMTEFVERTVVVTQVVDRTSPPTALQVQIPQDVSVGDKDEDEQSEDEQPAPAQYVTRGRQLLDKWLRGNFNEVQNMLEDIPDEIQDENPDVLFVRGQLLGLGIGDVLDKDEAGALYQKSSCAGSTLGKAARLVWTIRQNAYYNANNEIIEIENELRKQAQNDDLGSSLWLAIILSIKKDPQYHMWLRRAHDKGAFQAELQLAGENVLQAKSMHDLSENVRILEKYAAQGVWFADCYLIAAYKKTGNEKMMMGCYERSCDKIEMSAENGDPLSIMVRDYMQGFQLGVNVRKQTIKMREDARQRLNQWQNRHRQNTWPVNQQNWTW